MALELRGVILHGNDLGWLMGEMVRPNNYFGQCAQTDLTNPMKIVLVSLVDILIEHLTSCELRFGQNLLMRVISLLDVKHGEDRGDTDK